MTKQNSSHRSCTICGKPIVLVPSAAERARRYGGEPKQYLDLFTTHSECQLQRNAAETSELMARLRVDALRAKARRRL